MQEPTIFPEKNLQERNVPRRRYIFPSFVKIPFTNKKKKKETTENPGQKFISPSTTHTSHIYIQKPSWKLPWPSLIRILREQIDESRGLIPRIRDPREKKRRNIYFKKEEKKKIFGEKMRTYLAFRREPNTDWPTRRAAARVDIERHPISSSLFRIACTVAAFTLPSFTGHRARPPSSSPARTPLEGEGETPSSPGGERWRRRRKRSSVSAEGRLARVLITWPDNTPGRQIATGVVNRGATFLPRVINPRCNPQGGDKDSFLVPCFVSPAM